MAPRSHMIRHSLPPQRVERRGPAGRRDASRRAKNALVAAAFVAAALYGWLVEPMWWAK